jgi:hypothetical protein
MAFSRRSFLRLTLGIGLLASSGYILKNVFLPSQITSRENKTLEALLDTLIPSDETPGAIELGTLGKIRLLADRDYQYRRLLKSGCAWLNDKAAEQNTDTFSSLSAAKREEVVRQAAGSRPESMPRLFFERIRSDAFDHYYAQPESWRALGYKGPPQPEGFPDYADAPPRHTS